MVCSRALQRGMVGKRFDAERVRVGRGDVGGDLAGAWARDTLGLTQCEYGTFSYHYLCLPSLHAYFRSGCWTRFINLIPAFHYHFYVFPTSTCKRYPYFYMLTNIFATENIRQTTKDLTKPCAQLPLLPSSSIASWPAPASPPRHLLSPNPAPAPRNLSPLSLHLPPRRLPTQSTSTAVQPYVYR
jgi:hypothetical protein